MTIASCYVSPEGVVLGADSTASFGTAGGLHYFNHTQKVFEIGSQSTLGIVTWGLGGLGPVAYRTLFAELGDSLEANAAASVADVMHRWIDLFWAAYQQAFATQPDFAQARTDLRRLHGLQAHDPVRPDEPGHRSTQEEESYQELRRILTAGFCIGGRTGNSRAPAAYFVHFEGLNEAPPTAVEIGVGYQFWGAPNMIQRLVFAADDATKQSIVSSGLWVGTADDLEAVLARHVLAHPTIPLRDAVDFVHACIYSTIKAIKFSLFSQVCGGPIELAVISTDRPFRWIRHKHWDAAVVDGAIS